ncbi:hypothetical protein TRAPUB_8063 [Trametes pubescens]|uniref:3'-5' exonuclease domain-containing protein n=1 Tax=Trametes pubescens TaxID=154538 RepID=A0A1M2W696_TRAPU|nr:hypothetical protein TRAPUB_8063 [Trametes pubescens]
MAPEITWCSTPASILHAASALSAHSVLLMDCEAQDLAMPDGALSTIAISGPLAEHVFIIDTLAFPSSPSRSSSTSSAVGPPTPHPGLAPLFALLSLPHITKVFWDGRADALELLLSYGLVLANVLDMQLVEVAVRARAKKPAEVHKGYFEPIQNEILGNPGAYAGIHRLRSLTHVVGFFQLVPKGPTDAKGYDLKDPVVVAMHEAGESAFWLERPLPEHLKAYAAHDLTLMSLVYVHFMRRAWVCKRLQLLCAQSAVYIGMLGGRAEHARLAAMDFKRFMPLGIISEEGDVGSKTRYTCDCCRGALGGDCFVKRVVEGPEGMDKDGSKTIKIERLSFCRLCNALAQRNKRAEGEWVDCCI